MADANNPNPNPGEGGGEGKHVENPTDDKNKNKSGEGDNKGDLTIPKHRFDEVSGRLKQLEAEKEERERKEKEAADKKLTEDKKFEELSAKRQQEIESRDSTIKTLKIERAVERVAGKLGAVDTEAIIALIDKSKLDVDKDGNVKNAEEVVKELLEAKPFLKSSGGTPANIGGGSNPDQPSGDKKPMSWVRERWADPKWCRDKHEELGGLTGAEYLNKLQADGLVDMNS